MSFTRHQSSRLGLSGASTLLLAIAPKCPLCWLALMSTIGVSWPVSSGWLRSFVIVLSFVPLGVLLLCARRSANYFPFVLGVVAVVALYVCKFRLALDAGMYLSGAVLFGATIWGVKAITNNANEIVCRCSVRTTPDEVISTGSTSIHQTCSEVMDG